MSVSHPDTHLAVHALRHAELVRQARLHRITAAAAEATAAAALPAVTTVTVPRQRGWRSAFRMPVSRTD